MRKSRSEERQRLSGASILADTTFHDSTVEWPMARKTSAIALSSTGGCFIKIQG
jgi:hypothetical protein